MVKPSTLAFPLLQSALVDVVSFESVYHPGNDDFEAGFRQCIGRFLEDFG